MGGAAIMGVNGALIRFIMPGRMLGQGIALIAVVVAVSGAAGPTIAAAILAVASWHWLFLINVPLGIICFSVGRFTLPVTPISPRRFDVLSALFNALTFGFLISGLSSIGTSGAPAWVPAGQLAIAAVSGTLLVRRQLGRPAPMFPVDLLKILDFRLSVMASITSFAAQFLATVSLPFFLANVLGYNEVQTGLLMTPWPVATAICAPFAGRFADRYAAAKLSGLGSLIFAIGLALTAVLPAHPAVWDIVWRLAITGLGFGLFQSPNNKVMISSTPRQRSGGASGMQATARLTGQSAGAALAAIIFGLTAGYNLMLTMGIATAFALAAAILSIWR
jgi:DHA2 family multidrug resistance protein-like MFS transporter